VYQPLHAHRDNHASTGQRHRLAKDRYANGKRKEIETVIAELLQQRTVKDWHSPDECAQILGESEFTVRE
jgi:hypothetical protein